MGSEELNLAKAAKWAGEVDRAVADLKPLLVNVRRHMHRNPEPSGEEFETTRFLRGILADAGVESRLGPEERGAVIDSPHAGGTQRVGLRGDIDALFIQDAKECEYRSQVPGVMHACGHDAHAACLVGSVLVLERLRKDGGLPWDVPWRAILQPAEETATGAKEMIATGVLEDVVGIFALHLDPSRELGGIGLRDGAFTASCDDFRINIQGRGGHGARPHETRDPVLAVAQLICALYQTLPRRLNVQDPVVATIGEIAAGHSSNVIPETAELKGTLRALHEKARVGAKEAMAEIVAGIAKTTGCEIELTFPVECPGVNNAPAMNDCLRAAAVSFPEGLAVEEMPHSSMGGEDFAEFTQLVPGAMFRLGCRPVSGCRTLHEPHFDLDERALGIGVRLLTRAVILRARGLGEEAAEMAAGI